MPVQRDWSRVEKTRKLRQQLQKHQMNQVARPASMQPSPWSKKTKPPLDAAETAFRDMRQIQMTWNSAGTRRHRPITLPKLKFMEGGE